MMTRRKFVANLGLGAVAPRIFLDDQETSRSSFLRRVLMTIQWSGRSFLPPPGMERFHDHCSLAWPCHGIDQFLRHEHHYRPGVFRKNRTTALEMVTISRAVVRFFRKTPGR